MPELTGNPHPDGIPARPPTPAVAQVGAAAFADEDRWRELAEEAGNPFLTPEWVRAWLNRNPGVTPVVLSVPGPDGALAGLMPFAQVPTGRRTRELVFPGDDLGDDFGPLAAPGVDPAAVAAAAGAALRGAPVAWDAVRLGFVPVGAPWVAAFAAALPPVRRFRLRTAGRPVIRVEDRDWDAYQAGLQRTVRKETRRLKRRLEEAHEVEYRLAGPGEARAALAELLRLHDLRWGDRSSLPEGPRRAVIADFSAAAAERGWLRLWLLVADGEPVAAELAWRVGDRQVHYQGGFDPDWAARGVGVTAMMHAVQAEWDAGVREFDLCQGLADYKVRYSTGIAEVESLRLVRRWSPARIGAEAHHLARDVIAPRLPERLRGSLSSLRRARSS